MQIDFTLIVAPYVPLIILLGIWRWHHQSTDLRSPVRTKLLRAPGESLMEEQEELNEKISLAFVILIFSPCVYIAYTSSANGFDKPDLAISLIIYALISIPTLWWLWGALTRRSKNHLGLQGERAVAEELNKLMLDGCHVYHDLKKDNGGNIDHVVVASSGVYCVETKCWRKGGAQKRDNDHEITFDGERLYLPRFSRTKELGQARGHCSYLGKYLSSATGEKVYAKGILTFPGWYVEGPETPIDNLRVLNPKRIGLAIQGDKQDVLSKKQIRQIVHQLDQKCRDVEF